MNAGKLPIVLFALWAPARAQEMIEASAAERLLASAAAKPERSRGCEIARVAPGLGYSLHYESGYSLRLFPGAGLGTTVLLRVTPEGGGTPVYLVERHPMVYARNEGWFRIGEGGYEVAATVFDDDRRLCRGRWRIRVRPNADERALAPRMAANAVASPGGAAIGEHRPASGRLTVLLHAAPLDTSLTMLRPSDASMLADMLSALVEKLPAGEVRLVVFSLGQRKELLRRDHFGRAGIEEVRRLIVGLQLGTVDVQTLAHRSGHLDFLAGLLNRELGATNPSGAIVMVGAPALTHDRLTDEAIPVRRMPLFYLECGIAPAPAKTPAAMEEFNTIRSTVAALDGRTFLIWRPKDFAAAVRQIAGSMPHAGL